jgi:hypothetical protein
MADSSKKTTAGGVCRKAARACSTELAIANRYRPA